MGFGINLVTFVIYMFIYIDLYRFIENPKKVVRKAKKEKCIARFY